MSSQNQNDLSKSFTRSISLGDLQSASLLVDGFASVLSCSLCKDTAGLFCSHTIHTPKVLATVTATAKTDSLTMSERVPWKESNLALIGSDLDHKIKAAAAEFEEQWQQVGKVRPCRAMSLASFFVAYHSLWLIQSLNHFNHLYCRRLLD
jgi:hypothetical protein